MRSNDALAEGVLRCAANGIAWLVLNAANECLWEIRPDTKVDDEDLTFPVIVQMGIGVETSDIALLVEVAA